jgi:hypothetical protein
MFALFFPCCLFILLFFYSFRFVYVYTLYILFSFMMVFLDDCARTGTMYAVCVCYARSYSKSEDEKGFVGGEGDLGTPESLPEPERPPLRHIDKYVRPECPCLSKRYTVAVLTCVGTV